MLKLGHGAEILDCRGNAPCSAVWNAGFFQLPVALGTIFPVKFRTVDLFDLHDLVLWLDRFEKLGLNR